MADYVNRYRFSSVGNEMFHFGTEYLLSTLVILCSLQCIAIFAFNAFDSDNIHKPLKVSEIMLPASKRIYFPVLCCRFQLGTFEDILL